MYHAITKLNDDDDDDVCVCMGGPPLFVYSQLIIGLTYFLEKHYGEKKKNRLNRKRAENKR